ncbi:n-acetylglucosaminyl transferase component gpi1 [Colletotrichum kahawae]|uniref:N-acetylglucosaminyl transferase component gpi1 n=1 Tax=Colletotrichum kahawae TaxID=34407 RepID=A0AAD9YGZ8_COLKA|nr:n-acetylglucosaminyl transferase component gpi1 [Colletotrichum kahawae]
MPENDGLMRIFWPTDIQRSDLPGVVVGWRNSSLDVFVVAILDDVDVSTLQHLDRRNGPQLTKQQAGHVEFALKAGTLFRNSPHPVNSIYERCGHGAMHVLGLTNPSDAVVLDPSLFVATTPANAKAPRITCARALSIQIILYDRPRPSRMQYISLNPISLALGNKEAPSLPPTEHMAEEEKHELKKKEQKRKLVEKLKQHTIVKRSPSPKERALPKIVNQINWSWELEQLLQKNISRIGTRPKRTLSVSERVVEQATTMRNFVWDLFIFYLLPLIQWGFVYMLMGHRAVAEFLLQILEFRLKDNCLALKDISATAQQVEIRLQQFCYWPMQYTTLRQRKNDWESVTTSHPDYIRFYNSLWLVANDVIIGIALGSYIIDNAEWAANAISELLSKYTVQALQRSISWLMGWPAGLKLNSELAMFLGDLFLWVIDYWSNCIVTLQPVLPHIIWFIGFSSFAGASMPIAMFSDLLSGLTVHIYSFYLASARIYHWQLTILISLFHLFRGKKHNVLRNRIDSCDYDLDQLLVGTILFTLLFFLLPTVVVFYLNFAIARMVIISLKAVFDTLLSCLNHFPLFALMLRVKDPRRLPGGIRFELRDTHDYRLNNTSNEPPTSVIYLKSIPLTFRAMFHQYFQMGNRIRKHYLSPQVLLCLLTGRFVPPLNRKNLYSLQYSMLPARRAGIRQMWDAITTVQPSRKPVPFAMNGRSNPRVLREPKHVTQPQIIIYPRLLVRMAKALPAVLRIPPRNLHPQTFRLGNGVRVPVPEAEGQAVAGRQAGLLRAQRDGLGAVEGGEDVGDGSEGG